MSDADVILMSCQAEPIDPEIRDVISGLNRLGFIQTLFSCAGYGTSGCTGKDHQKQDNPYVVIRYSRSCSEGQSFHCRLGQIADHVVWFGGARAYGYYFADPEMRVRRMRKADLQAQHRARWERVRELVQSWSSP